MSSCFFIWLLNDQYRPLAVGTPNEDHRSGDGPPTQRARGGGSPDPEEDGEPEEHRDGHLRIEVPEPVDAGHRERDLIQVERRPITVPAAGETELPSPARERTLGLDPIVGDVDPTTSAQARSNGAARALLSFNMNLCDAPVVFQQEWPRLEAAS